jgi:hypothetical protein
MDEKRGSAIKPVHFVGDLRDSATPGNHASRQSGKDEPGRTHETSLAKLVAFSCFIVAEGHNGKRRCRQA